MTSDLYSVGCPSGSRLSENPDEKEKTQRIEEAIGYLPLIKNTSCYWLMRTILADLYNWTDPITLDNQHQLDELIQKKSSGPDRARQIFAKANIEKANTELP